MLAWVGVRHTGCDTETSLDIVPDCEDGGLLLEGRPVGGDKAGERDEEDEDTVEPVDVLVPVGSSDGHLCDVGLLHVLGLPTERLVFPGAIVDDGSALRLGRRRSHGERGCRRVAKGRSWRKRGVEEGESRGRKGDCGQDWLYLSKRVVRDDAVWRGGQPRRKPGE